MKPYGLDITKSLNIHPHNVCSTCCAYVKNKKTARQNDKKEIEKQMEGLKIRK